MTQAPVQAPLAAFDFDGTITTRDSLVDFLRITVGGARLAGAVLRSLPWLLACALGLCSRDRAKARLLAATLGGRTKAELDAAARDYAVRHLPRLLRPDMLQRIRRHQSLGHRLVLVSASPSIYLRHWARQAGFDAVLATELQFIDDRFTGRLLSPNCWGMEKVRRLQGWSQAQALRLHYAYGDSRGDREMLSRAEHPWLRGGRDPMPRLPDTSGSAPSVPG